jgi:hypothetical protein
MSGEILSRRLPLVVEEEEEKNACLHVPIFIFNGASL